MCHNRHMNTQAVVAIPSEASNALTLKQELFLAAYVQTMSASSAYKQAYETTGMSDSSVYVEACRLLKHPKIAPRIGSLVEATQQRAMEHAIANVERTQKLAAIADDVENETAARLAVAERAIRTQHEVAGTIRSGGGVLVQINNANVDGGAMGDWNAVGPDGLTGAERFRASQARVVEPEPGT